MKNSRKMIIVAGFSLAVTMMGITSCENSEDPPVNDIEGEYIGSFSVSSSLKSTQYDGNYEDHAIANVSMRSDMQIEVHCFGEEIDTTFMLNRR